MMLTTTRKPVSRKPSVPKLPVPNVPLDVWVEDAHLAIEVDGTVWLRHFPDAYSDFPNRIVGWADSGCDWPAELGQEPRWWLTETAYLIDLWLDSRRVYP